MKPVAPSSGEFKSVSAPIHPFSKTATSALSKWTEPDPSIHRQANKAFILKC